MVRTIAKDYDAKRDKILTAAAGVFAQRGVAGASMAEVAKACGISKGNIYHYYDSKLAILFDILDSYLCRLRDRIIAVQLDANNVPQCLFLDEPTASLDGSATKEIEALLQEAAANGTTLIMSTHNVGQAKRLGDHVLFLHQGKPILYAPASQVFDESNKGGQNELVQRFLQGDIIE